MRFICQEKHKFKEKKQKTLQPLKHADEVFLCSTTHTQTHHIILYVCLFKIIDYESAANLNSVSWHHHQGIENSKNTVIIYKFIVFLTTNLLNFVYYPNLIVVFVIWECHTVTEMCYNSTFIKLVTKKVLAKYDNCNPSLNTL